MKEAKKGRRGRCSRQGYQDGKGALIGKNMILEPGALEVWDAVADSRKGIRLGSDAPIY